MTRLSSSLPQGGKIPKALEELIKEEEEEKADQEIQVGPAFEELVLPQGLGLVRWCCLKGLGRCAGAASRPQVGGLVLPEGRCNGVDD